MTFYVDYNTILQVGQLLGPEREAADILGIATGIFALILFFLSMYAWTRRRQFSLILVASSFLLYFLKQVIELLAETYDYDPGWLLLIFIDFVILGIFFIAIVVMPRGRPSIASNQI